MVEVSVSSLDERQQKLVENARIALERGDVGYALDACAEVLRAAPACLPVRRLQRIAQLRRFSARNRLVAKALGGWSATPFRLGGGQKSPMREFAMAEKLLALDPTNVAALAALGEAALELGWPETAVFAFDAGRQLAPDDRATLLALGRAWLAAGRPDEALRWADAVLREQPVDADAQKLMRRASIAQTVAKGNWATASSFRDKLKEGTPAGPPEPPARGAPTADPGQRLIDEALARVAAEPANLNHHRALVNGYRQLGRIDDALAWLRKVREQPGAEAALAQEEAELRAQLREGRLAAAGRPADGAAQEPCEGLHREPAEFRLAEAERAVARYPNDGGAREALGRLYFESGKTDLAIAQFQQAQKSPPVRIAALVGLGRAFKAKRLFDLAVAQFTTAKRELGALDDTKKEVIYELGGCLEAMGDAEAAIAEFKAVYSADIGFRDVAEKIDAYYARK